MADKPEINPQGLGGPEITAGDETSAVVSGVAGNAADLWKNVTDRVERPAEQVPVVADVDVVVAGAGVAGLIAALASARGGAKTLLLDAFSSLGGNIGPGMFAGGSMHLALQNDEAFPNGLPGIPRQFNDRITGDEDRLVGGGLIKNGAAMLGYFRDPNIIAAEGVRMMEEAGVELLLSAFVSGAIMEADAVRGVFVETKSGTLAIKSKVVIDCTGTADVADRAGAPVIEQPANPSGGVCYAIANVDYKRYKDALAERGDLGEEDKQWVASHAPGASGFMPWARTAWEADEFRIVEIIGGFATLEVGMKPAMGDSNIILGRTRVNGNLQPADALALSKVDCKTRVFLYDFVEFLKNNVPGFENAYLHMVSPFTHFRGGKSIDGQYVIEVEDVKRSARQDDVIFVYYDDKTNYAGGCDIPYRMLVPKKTDGLLAAGKSAVRRGPQIRQRTFLQLMGQAAGAAAALAVEAGVEPREIDVKELQRRLHALGNEFGPDKRLRELGLL